MLKLIFEDRKKQLEKQEEIDKVLKKLREECPDIVSDYLLLHRKITRSQQYNLMNSSVFLIHNELKKGLITNEGVHTNFFIKMEKYQTCQVLRDLIRDDSERLF